MKVKNKSFNTYLGGPMTDSSQHIGEITVMECTNRDANFIFIFIKDILKAMNGKLIKKIYIKQ